MEGGPKRGKVSQAPFGMALPLPPYPSHPRAKWQFMLQLRMPTLQDVEVKKISTVVASTFVVRTNASCRNRWIGTPGFFTPHTAYKGGSRATEKTSLLLFPLLLLCQSCNNLFWSPLFPFAFGIAPLAWMLNIQKVLSTARQKYSLALPFLEAQNDQCHMILFE